jgi:nicotinamide-nucleotide amidase
MTAAAERIHVTLLARGETVATAESLTGGLLAAALTTTPGASSTYRGGLVAYATDLKATVAGVPAALLAERGAVDPDVAAALARGARDRLGATWGLATTGVAGPSPQDGVAVGTVFVAVAGPDAHVEVSAANLPGGRDEVRAATVDRALDMLGDTLHRREYRG